MLASLSYLVAEASAPVAKAHDAKASAGCGDGRKTARSQACASCVQCDRT